MPLLLYGSCRCTGSTIHIEKQHCNQKDSFIYWPWWNLFHHENSEGLNYFNQLKPTDLMWEYHLFSCSKLTRTFNGSFLLWSAIRDSLPDHPAESTTILGSCLCRFPIPAHLPQMSTSYLSPSSLSSQHWNQARPALLGFPVKAYFQKAFFSQTLARTEPFSSKQREEEACYERPVLFITLREQNQNTSRKTKGRMKDGFSPLSVLLLTTETEKPSLPQSFPWVCSDFSCKTNKFISKKIGWQSKPLQNSCHLQYEKPQEIKISPQGQRSPSISSPDKKKCSRAELCRSTPLVNAFWCYRRYESTKMCLGIFMHLLCATKIKWWFDFSLHLTSLNRPNGPAPWRSGGTRRWPTIKIVLGLKLQLILVQTKWHILFTSHRMDTLSSKTFECVLPRAYAGTAASPVSPSPPVPTVLTTQVKK